MNGRIPVTNEDYRRLTQLFLLFLGVNANLVKNGWDENSNHARIVSKNREEGPAGPVFEKGISKWNIEEEKRKDAEAIARAKAAVEAAHLAAIRAANAEAAKKQAEGKGSDSDEKQG